jgi:hypothetical protein
MHKKYSKDTVTPQINIYSEDIGVEEFYHDK